MSIGDPISDPETRHALEIPSDLSGAVATSRFERRSQAKLLPRVALEQPSETDELRYRQELTRRVGKALSHGKHDLQSICRRVAGAFPLDVIETARDFTGADLKNIVMGRAVRISSGAAKFAEPLLIDSDWRFDLSSARYMREQQPAAVECSVSGCPPCSLS